MGTDQTQLGPIMALLTPLISHLFSDVLMVDAVEAIPAKPLLTEIFGDGVGPCGLRQRAVKGRVEASPLG